MAFQGEDIYINTTTADGINHAMFISNATTPFALKIALQGFWFTKTCERMLLNILKQGGNALHNLLITCLLPVVAVFLGFLQQNYFHRSSIATGWHFPSAISFSPWFTISSSSAIVITSALAPFFCKARRLSERTAFFIKPSSPDMVWSAPKSSALSRICTAVITFRVYFFLQKYK